MGYLHIDNLYTNQDMFMFKECYAMEKIHGTSAHISFKNDILHFSSGGAKYETFVQLFNTAVLVKLLKELVPRDCSTYIYGEAYGGKCQGMATTYGSQLRFVAFDVKIGDVWVSIPKAEQLCRRLGLDFVHYAKIPMTLEALDNERDLPSVQAIRNGMGHDKMREGIVLRPLEECIKSNGNRIIAKYKRDEFKETRTPRKITDKLVKMTEIRAIIDEWVTEERLNHILTKGVIEKKIENMGKIITSMIEDIYREGREEITPSPDLGKAIGRETALMFKRRLHAELKEIKLHD